MTKEELAEMLDGREYGGEINDEIQTAMRETDLVVLFGYSDDNAEFRGAINDEVGCYGGGDIYIDGHGLNQNQCGDECPYFHIQRGQSKKIKALWCSEPDICWTYETDIPHATFMIFEDGEKYCRGIVFNLCSVP